MKVKRPDLSGKQYGYLGHFRKPKHLRAGHNTVEEDIAQQQAAIEAQNALLEARIQEQIEKNKQSASKAGASFQYPSAGTPTRGKTGGVSLSDRVRSRG